jgi:hypothetical protein
MAKQIYNSPYLKKEFKPTINSFELPAELKSLQPLILLQHEAFSTSIKDLGNITLILSKIIEKKRRRAIPPLKTTKISQEVIA